MTGVLTASFTRRRGRTDRVQVTRSDAQPRVEQAGKIILARLDPESCSTREPHETARQLAFQLPGTATPDRVDAIRGRLQQLGQQWRGREDATITLTITRGSH